MSCETEKAELDRAEQEYNDAGDRYDEAVDRLREAQAQLRYFDHPDLAPLMTMEDARALVEEAQQEVQLAWDNYFAAGEEWRQKSDEYHSCVNNCPKWAWKSKEEG